MAKCELCGLEAGFLRKRHKECQEKHDAAKTAIEAEASRLAITGGELADFSVRAASSAQAAFIDQAALRALLIGAWEIAVTTALEDDVLSKEEETALVNYSKHFAFSQGDLDTNGAFSRVVKAAIIRDLLEDKYPDRVTVEGQIPFNLQKAESLLWFFNNVAYFEETTRTTYQGGYQGASVRIARGLYYRVGGFRGNPVVTTRLAHVADGQLGVTQKHIYFAGGNKAFRVPYPKIVAFTPYSDGIGIQRDAITSRPQIFITGDGWFTYNLVNNLSRMSAA